MYSYCPTGMKGHSTSARLMYSYCPSIVNPSDRTMALGSTQRLTEMSTRCIFWGKDGRCVGLTTLPPFCAVVTKSGNLNFLEPSRPFRACNGTALPLLSLYWTEVSQYLYRLIYSCCPAVGLKGHNMSARLMYSYCPNTGLLLT